MRNSLIANPSLSYNFPFYHYQSGTSQNFVGIPAGSGLVQIPLQGFINSDLIGIYFYVVLQSNVTPSANNTPSTFASANIYNIDLQYNGQSVYKAQGNSWKLVNMFTDTGASYFNNQLWNVPSNTSPIIGTGVNSYITFIDFTKTRKVCNPEGGFDNCYRVSNQTLNLYFSTDDTQNYIFIIEAFFSHLIAWLCLLT